MRDQARAWSRSLSLSPVITSFALLCITYSLACETNPMGRSHASEQRHSCALIRLFVLRTAHQNSSAFNSFCIACAQLRHKVYHFYIDFMLQHKCIDTFWTTRWKIFWIYVDKWTWKADVFISNDPSALVERIKCVQVHQFATKIRWCQFYVRIWLSRAQTTFDVRKHRWFYRVTEGNAQHEQTATMVVGVTLICEQYFPGLKIKRISFCVHHKCKNRDVIIKQKSWSGLACYTVHVHSICHAWVEMGTFPTSLSNMKVGSFHRNVVTACKYVDFTIWMWVNTEHSFLWMCCCTPQFTQ